MVPKKMTSHWDLPPGSSVLTFLRVLAKRERNLNETRDLWPLKADMAKNRGALVIFFEASPSWPRRFSLRAGWFGAGTSTMSCGCWRGRLKQQQQTSALQKGAALQAKMRM